MAPAAPARRASLSRQAATVLAGSLAVAVLTFVVTRMYANHYGAASVSAVLLFRLYSSVLLAAAAIGMPIALTRNVAFLSAQPSRAATAAVVGLGIGMCTIGAACFVSALVSDRIARLVDDPSAGPLWKAFALLTFTQGVATMLTCVQLARGLILRATAISVLAFGLAPILPLVVLPHVTLPTAIAIAAGLAALVTVPFLLQTVQWALESGFRDQRREARQLLGYGLPRALATLLELMMEAAVPWVAASRVGLEGAGHIAIGLALIRPLNPITSALNQVMTPAAATAAAASAHDAQRTRAALMSQSAIQLGLFVGVQLIVWCDVLIKMWLGPTYGTAATTARIIGVSLLPTFLFQTSRGFIDGESERPVNTYSLLWACGLLAAATAAIIAVSPTERSLAWAYVLAKVLLGLLTLRYTLRRHALDFAALRLTGAAGVTLALGAVALLLRWLAPPSLLVPAMLIVGPASLVVFVAYLASRDIVWASRALRFLGVTKLATALRGRP